MGLPVSHPPLRDSPAVRLTREPHHKVEGSLEEDTERPGIEADAAVHGHHRDAGFPCPFSGGHDVLVILERLNVTHHDERAVTGRPTRLKQIRSLCNGAGDRASTLSHYTR